MSGVYRLPIDPGGSRQQEAARLHELASADLQYHSANRLRQYLWSAVVVLSVMPWLRSLALPWMPRALVEAGVALWAAALLMGAVVRLHEWARKRDFERCVARLAAEAPDSGAGGDEPDE